MPMINNIFNTWVDDADPDSSTSMRLFHHLLNNDLDTMISYGGLLTHSEMDQMITFAELRKKQQDDKLLLKELISQLPPMQQVKLDYDSIYQKLDVTSFDDGYYVIDTTNMHGLTNYPWPDLSSIHKSSIREIVSDALKFDTSGYTIKSDHFNLWEYIKIVADEIKEKIYDKQQRPTKHAKRDWYI